MEVSLALSNACLTVSGLNMFPILGLAVVFPGLEAEAVTVTKNRATTVPSGLVFGYPGTKWMLLVL